MSIGDRTWVDTNRDGVQDEGESPLEGVTVELLNAANDAVIATQVTDIDGHYRFSGLAAGTYHLRFTPAAGYLASPTRGTTDAARDSDGPIATPFAYAAGTVDNTIDSGFYKPGTVGDLVWVDVDRNGRQDPGEPGLPGVTATLVDADGVPFRTDRYGRAITPQVTDRRGHYLFTDLPLATTYGVRFSGLPNGVVLTAVNQPGVDDALDSDGIYANPVTINLLDDIRTIDLGVWGVGGVGDYVWKDANHNGIQDEPPSAGVNGVQITLVTPDGTPITQDADGNPLAPQVTANDASGNPGYWLFPRVASGTVGVRYGNLPAGFEPTVTDAGADDTLDSDGPTPEVTLLAGSVDRSIDLGLWAAVTIGDRVWIDLDHDGIQDTCAAGTPPTQCELGLPGVRVDLLDATGAPGVRDAEGAVVPNTTTDGQGEYRFEDLMPGRYRVRFTPPAGWNFTLTDVGADDTVDSDGPEAATANLSLGMKDLSVDAGFWAPASIGDRVWIDLDHDGIQDACPSLAPCEAGQPGIPVTLRGADGSMVATTVSGALGDYRFDGLLPGTYRVEFGPLPAPLRATRTDAADDAIDSDGLTPPAVTLAPGQVLDTIDLGVFAPASIGDQVWTDVDGDGRQGACPGSAELGCEPGIAGVTVTLLDGTAAAAPVRDADGATVAPVVTLADGRYRFANLLPGTYQVRFSTLPAGFVPTVSNVGDDLGDSDGLNPPPVTLALGADDLSIDLGAFRPVEVGDRVWIDLDGDGVQDPCPAITSCEPGLAGVSVTLVDGSGSAVVADALGGAVGPAVTDATGAYHFTNLLPGSYAVRFGALPRGLQPTLTDVGDDTTDSDGPTPGARRLTSGMVDRSFDLGVVGVNTLGGHVYLDKDNDGRFDLDELPLGGVTVSLAGRDGRGQDVTATALSDAAGNWTFPGLWPGRYTVTETQPEGYLDGRDTAGNLGGTVADDRISDIPLSSASAPLTGLADPRAGTGYDFGELAPASLSGRVFVDANDDTIADPEEHRIDEVEIQLSGTDDRGAAVAFTARTGEDGTYRFGGLRPGIYQLVEVQPLPYTDGRDHLGTAGGVLGNDRFSGIVLSAGQAGEQYDFGEKGGTIAGRIWLDDDRDGTYTAAESPLAAVRVTLIDPETGDIVFSTISQANGRYQFRGLSAGRYAVTVDRGGLFAGALPTFDIDGVGTPDTARVTLGVDQARTDVSFGYRDQVDVAVTKRGPTDLEAGKLSNWTLTVTSPGPSVEPGPITLVDTLPADIRFDSASGEGWSCSAAAQVVTCQHPGPLAPGGSLGLVITTQTGPDAKAVVMNVAEVRGTRPDDNLANNRAQAEGTVRTTVLPERVGDPNTFLPRTGTETASLVGFGIELAFIGLALRWLARRLRRSPA